MFPISQVFSSTPLYQQAFEEGLANILQSRTAGTFILACANIFQHPDFMPRHHQALHEVYKHIADHYRLCDSEGRQPGDAHDDVAVMRQIIALGLDGLDPIEYRSLDAHGAVYRLGYNQLRSFRPARMSTVKDIRLNTPFNADGFHFDKPFLRKETFAEGTYLGRDIALLYNKFPFVEYHALLIIDKGLHHHQFLSREYLDYVSRLQTRAQQQIPDLVITYNSLGAGASVNHLHFQVFIETQPLALFSPELAHNGGTQSYPAACRVFTDVETAWDDILQLHSTNVPYNLLFRDQKIYCLPRRLDYPLFPELNVSTYGWSDMAGAFNINDKAVFDQLTADRLSATIRAVSHPAFDEVN